MGKMKKMKKKSGVENREKSSTLHDRRGAVQMTCVAEELDCNPYRSLANPLFTTQHSKAASNESDLLAKPLLTAQHSKAPSILRVKLLLDNKAQKVLFAEAGKEVVDFLFNLLTLPVGTVVKLLTKDSMVGSLGNLYNSVEKLSEAYIEANQTKASLLEPKLPSCVAQVPLLLFNPTSTTTSKGTVNYYRCSYGSSYPICNYLSNNPRVCPQGHGRLSTLMTYVAGTETTGEEPSGDGGGYVKGLVTYMVMDDLSVTPMSTISSITLLNKLNVRELNSLEEKVFDLGMDEGLAILKASLQSKTVLTDVFLGKELKRPS